MADGDDITIELQAAAAAGDASPQQGAGDELIAPDRVESQRKSIMKKMKAASSHSSKTQVAAGDDDHPDMDEDVLWMRDAVARKGPTRRPTGFSPHAGKSFGDLSVNKVEAGCEIQWDGSHASASLSSDELPDLALGASRGFSSGKHSWIVVINEFDGAWLTLGVCTQETVDRADTWSLPAFFGWSSRGLEYANGEQQFANVNFKSGVRLIFSLDCEDRSLTVRDLRTNAVLDLRLTANPGGKTIAANPVFYPHVNFRAKKTALEVKFTPRRLLESLPSPSLSEIHDVWNRANTHTQRKGEPIAQWHKRMDAAMGDAIQQLDPVEVRRVLAAFRFHALRLFHFFHSNYLLADRTLDHEVERIKHERAGDWESELADTVARGRTILELLAYARSNVSMKPKNVKPAPDAKNGLSPLYGRVLAPWLDPPAWRRIWVPTFLAAAVAIALSMMYETGWICSENAPPGDLDCSDPDIWLQLPLESVVWEVLGVILGFLLVFRIENSRSRFEKAQALVEDMTGSLRALFSNLCRHLTLENAHVGGGQVVGVDLASFLTPDYPEKGNWHMCLAEFLDEGRRLLRILLSQAFSDLARPALLRSSDLNWFIRCCFHDYSRRVRALRFDTSGPKHRELTYLNFWAQPAVREITTLAPEELVWPSDLSERRKTAESLSFVFDFLFDLRKHSVLPANGMDECVDALIEFRTAWTSAHELAYRNEPRTYKQLLSLLIAVFCFSLPLLLVPHWRMFAFVPTVIVSLGVTGLTKIADDLEQPFGADVTDIPLHDVLRNFPVELAAEADHTFTKGFFRLLKGKQAERTKVYKWLSLLQPIDDRKLGSMSLESFSAGRGPELDASSPRPATRAQVLSQQGAAGAAAPPSLNRAATYVKDPNTLPQSLRELLVHRRPHSQF